jgi:ABC-2 type transport system ATP-binding protein
VQRRYGSVLALSDVTFELEKGVTALLGANGSGKTTLILHAIRQLLDDRPHRIRLRSSDPLRLASALMGSGTVSAVQTAGDGAIVVDTPSVSPFRHALPRLVRDLGLHLVEVAPLDDDLESVFRYLVARRSP